MSVNVSFTTDEHTVTIVDGATTYVLPRPVVVPWSYSPTGTTYWVRTDGSDGNSGLADSAGGAFLTIRHALSVATTAGDCVYVRAGSYTEGDASGCVRFAASGTSGNPIVLSCAPGDLGDVYVTPSAAYVTAQPGGAVVTVAGASHIWINGLVIEGPRGRPEAPESEMFGANGITWTNGAGLDCRVTNSVICHNVHCGLKEMGHGGTHILMQGNVILENGTTFNDHGVYCPASDVTMDGNIVFNHPGWAFHCYEQPARARITRNVCFGNTWSGILLGGPDAVVLHNTCANNGQGVMYFRGFCQNPVVYNNVFAFNTGNAAWDNGGGQFGDPGGIDDDYNDYYSGTLSNAYTRGAHEVLTDPLFVDAAAYDFRLKTNPASPCLLAGSDGRDLGAYVVLRESAAGRGAASGRSAASGRGAATGRGAA